MDQSSAPVIISSLLSLSIAAVRVRQLTFPRMEAARADVAAPSRSLVLMRRGLLLLLASSTCGYPVSFNANGTTLVESAFGGNVELSPAAGGAQQNNPFQLAWTRRRTA